MQLIRFIFIFWTGLLWAATPSPDAAADTDATLERQASAYWQAQVDQDWETVYRLLPVEEKQGVSKPQFVAFKKAKGPLEYLSAKVLTVTSADNIGWVEIEYRARPYGYPQIPPRNIHTWQVWEHRDGRWTPVPSARLPEFPSRPPELRSKADEAALTRRAQAYWQAREEKDWDRLYQFLEPALRARISKARLLKSETRFLYLDHHIEWAEAIGPHGRVKTRFRRKLNDPWLPKLQPEEKISVEPWVNVEGEWYRKMSTSMTGGNR